MTGGRRDVLAWHAAKTMITMAPGSSVLEDAALAVTARSRDTADAADLLAMCGLVALAPVRRPPRTSPVTRPGHVRTAVIRTRRRTR